MALPTLRSILIPTDFSDDAAVAFAHALKLAVALQAELDIFHVEPDNDQSDWHWAPSVLGTLKQWGALPPGATAADLDKLGIRARRSMTGGVKAGPAILQAAAENHADLVVMSTHGRAGLLRLLQPSVAMPVALKGVAPVLLLPPGSKGFVDADTGEAHLRHLLLPIDHRPHPAPGFDLAKILSRALPADEVRVTTLHIGNRPVETDLLDPEPSWLVRHVVDSGPVVERVLAAALESNCDLIVAVTEGRRGLVDALRGSTVERLIEQSRIPVLIVPQQD